MLTQILLSVIAVLLIVNILITSRKENLRKLSIQKVIASSIHDVFEHEMKEMSKAYAEERRVLQWIEELMEKGMLDVSKLPAATEKRAFALALKKAEDAVIVSETVLADLKREISKKEKDLHKNIAAGLPRLVEADKQALKDLAAQEKFMTNRVQSEREILAKLALSR